MHSAKTILFVDDEANVLRCLRRSLLEEPYNCLFAQSAREALALLEHHEIHAILSDLCMPGMNGLELLTYVGDRYPHILQIALSGHPIATRNLMTISRNKNIQFIPKPWDPQKLKILLRQIVQQPAENAQHNVRRA